jgi:spermidine/putrescine transport system substrate-binding protein
MTKIDPSLAENPLIFPDDAMLADTFDFMTLTSQQEQDYQSQFASVIGA